MTQSRGRYLLLSALASLVLLPSTASAQVTAGTILGSVRDSTGAGVPGATVVIKEVSKGTSVEYQTNEDGAYTAPFLTPGTYTVNVQKAGFKPQATPPFELQVDQRARMDFTLNVGDVSATVEVTAAAPLVKSDSAELGQVITERPIKELPLNGRNFAQLVYLAPNVTPGQQGENLSGASSFNPRGASNFNALGSQANMNAWLIDGIDNNEYTFNTVILQPSIESVREFKVLTGSFSAEFGRGAGVVSVSSKSGTNELHGNAFEFLRNDVLDARNYFNPKSQLKPPYRRNQYGVAAGGPIVLPKIYDGKNKSFFYMDYFGMKERKGLTFVNTVPTAQNRLGDFSNFTDTSGNLIKIYDPLTTRLNPAYDSTKPVSSTNPQFLRDLFAGNSIPSARINPVSANVASIFPLPNGSGNFNNYTSSIPRTVDDDGFNVRVDHQISEKDNFFARYSYETYRLSAPQGQANCCLPTPQAVASKYDLGPYVAGLQVTDLTTQGMAINETHVFRPNIVNEFRGGFAKTNPFTRQSDFGHSAATSLGITGVNISSYSSGIPNINITDFTGLSGGPSFLPANPRETHWQAEDGVSWTLGHHQTKFGYRYVRRMTSTYTGPPGGGPRGDMTFGKNFTNDPVTNTQGTGLATMLVGYISGGNGRSVLLEPYYATAQDHSFYFQDDWRVNSRLTINVGLRYDIFVPDVEIRNRLVNFDYTNLKLAYAGEDGVSTAVGKETRKGNIGPRIGVAYNFGDGKTVVRAGFGRTYFPVNPSGSNMLGEQVPYTISQAPFGNIATNPVDYSVLPTIARPFPAIAVVKPKTTAELNAANPVVLGHGFANQTPSMNTFTFNIERQLTASMMAEVAYAGSVGSHITFGYNANEVQPGTGSNASRRLLQPLSNVATISMFDPRNSSSYNGLSGKLEKRFSSGLQFLAAYTYSKSLDFGGSAASGGGSVGGPQTITNIRAGHGPSGFDVKHRFVANYLYELPFGKGKKWVSSGPLTWVLGGWNLAGITTLSTGRPYSLSLASGVNNGAPSWPNRIGNGTLDNPDRAKWFDATAFVAPPSNTYGNVGRGVLYSPGLINWDISFVKRTMFRERYGVTFQLDAFNITNTPAFGFPNASIGSPTVGQITTTNSDNRDLQFGLKFQF
ncbi:TonB-dependent receptor [uncultured Paludibaculum sp.]|uniref:TonB-dependent receptor n=1 Tax=uncultured Paludibaculum sp. TaxID=1765020 RepID=UPI002AAAE895|nr:TonB-dependent receptor [uncultured Paludibaculum sp.]